jgi:AraC family transcriptional regulator
VNTGTAESANSLDRSPDSFEEIAFELAGAVIPLVSGTVTRARSKEIRDSRRIAHVLRQMEASNKGLPSIADLARVAGLSRYHFLRTFKLLTGVTPHQWLLRMRLRNAAERLVTSTESITDIALDVGFDDLSNFIRSFRAEFGVSPRHYRASK